MRTCVIIPTYNEALHIGDVVKEVKLQNCDIVVIDDGSQDKTAQIAGSCGVVVLRNEQNQGKGASLIKGFNYCMPLGYDAVITMDGDGQHLSQDIPFFIRLADSSPCSIFIGNRMQRARGMPFVRFITNKFMSWFLSGLTGQFIPDTQCGFRLIKRDVLEKVTFATQKYETESELLIKASRLGFKIESVPIKAIYSGEKSSINPFIDTLRFIRLAIRNL